MSKQFTVEGENGFHLRPITLLVQLSGKFDSTITISKDGNQVGTGSVMELLLLGAQKGDVLEVTVTGADSADALNAIEAFFKETAQGND
ncbi:MAG: HPr family phosphocarrier protein [Lentisphaeria bacterium]|nr:HPr family phosphocarrier protein [Lentisphaeria bacterium]